MELYLSRIRLNPYSKSVMKDMGSPKDLHRTISGWFPAIGGQDGKLPHEKQTPRNAYKLLHRLDRNGDGFVLYVQSAIRPDWRNLRSDYAIDAATKPLHDLYVNIAAGDTLRFRLQANPSKRAGKNDTLAADKFKDPKKRRRIDVRTEDDRIHWLERKGSECGFRLRRLTGDERIVNAAAGMQPALKFPHKSGEPRITLGVSVFEGVLDVTDPDAFRGALADGIGPGKAYGFGLMSIAPVR